MMEMKVSELEGAALDWAVGHALGASIRDHRFEIEGSPKFKDCTVFPDGRAFSSWHPSTNWRQGGPLIEKLIGLASQSGGSNAPFYAETRCGNMDGYATGATLLIAACRAIIAAKLGDTVSIPAELAEAQS